MSGKKRSLGRGLDAMLGASAPVQPSAAPPAEASGAVDERQPRQLPVDLVQRGRYLLRKDFEPASLQELAVSIKAQGVMQPIVVRPISGSRYEIIAGERRWRAAQLAGLDAIPALVAIYCYGLYAIDRRRHEEIASALRARSPRVTP